MHADDPNMIGVLTLRLPYIASDWDMHGAKMNMQVEGEVIVVSLDTERKGSWLLSWKLMMRRKWAVEAGPWRDYWNMPSAGCPRTRITCRDKIQLT